VPGIHHASCCCFACVSCPEPCDPDDFWPSFYRAGFAFSSCFNLCSRGTSPLILERYIVLHELIESLPTGFDMCLARVDTLTISPPLVSNAEYYCQVPLSRFYDYTLYTTIDGLVCDEIDPVQDAMLFAHMSANYLDTDTTEIRATLRIRLARQPVFDGVGLQAPHWTLVNTPTQTHAGEPGDASVSAFDTNTGPCGGFERLGHSGGHTTIPCDILIP
jgi:hypothetical protein